MDRKTNESRITETQNELKSYGGATALNVLLRLIEYRIEKYRILNDTAPMDEVSKNQGAIQELLGLYKILT